MKSHPPSPAALPIEPEPGQSRYAALAAVLRHRVIEGEWPPGVSLPAETRLATEHGVALGTLRRALELLVEEGLIERRHGKGTFVRGGLAGAPMLRFFRFGAGDGEIPTSRVLSRRSVAATPEVARRLSIGRGVPVLQLQRLRSLEGQPRLLEDMWLPLPTFAPLLDVPLNDWGDLLYPLLIDRCNVMVIRAIDAVNFTPLTAAQARLLDLPAGHPGVTVTRQSYDSTGRCVELRFTRADAYAFHYSVAIV